MSEFSRWAVITRHLRQADLSTREKRATEEPQPNEGDPMNDQSILLLSELERDLDAPGGGWPAYLAGRGVPIVEDDLGRPAIARADARQLFVERREAEARRREVAARNDAEIEARRQAGARPGWTLPPGMTVAEAIASAEYAAHGYSGPRRRTPVEDALDRDGGLVYHPIRHESAGDGS